MIRYLLGCVSLLLFLTAGPAFAQSASISGVVRDDSGAPLPGATVELQSAGVSRTVFTDAAGVYRLDAVPAGQYRLVFTLINFATTRREVLVGAGDAAPRVDVVLHFAVNADVTVTGRRTFANLADVSNPEEDLVGIAQAASQGAITAHQIETRPLMRQGEVLETIPGVIVTQHSGEGKANQYFLRGFSLDHGTDFATSVAGMPANMPTHAHGQGYTDVNFLIPELVSGVQFSKGPYYADQADFATAGSSSITYANVLEQPVARVEAGTEGYARALFAASPPVGRGHLLVAAEVAHNDGPWTTPDAYRKVNGVARYSQGDAVNGWSLTGMAYHGTWNATDQVPQRAIQSGIIGRFGAIDSTDGGHSYRYSGSFDWQRGTPDALTKVTAYGIGYDLDLFSNFTYFLDDLLHGDQVEQADHRFVTGGKVSHRRIGHWGGRPTQNTVGVQIRNDDISRVGLYHTAARGRLDTRSEDAVLQTAGGVFAQNEVEWTPWLRTVAGVRLDAVRFRVDALDPVNSGVASASLVSPKASLMLGPWRGTELYVNGGSGFHSNDARGTTLTRDADGNPATRVTPLVRAMGAEVGIRTVAVPRLQSTLSLWTLRLDSELVFSGDSGTTEASRPSARVGVEWTNYYRPTRWLTIDGDVSASRARFTNVAPEGDFVPEAVNTVLSGGITVDDYRKWFGSLRWRYFGPRALIEDSSVRSKATSLVNMQAGYQLLKTLRISLDVFNLLNAKDSDIDYFYASRLPGEPAAGVDDIHTHPALPRAARVSLTVGF